MSRQRRIRLWLFLLVVPVVAVGIVVSCRTRGDKSPMPQAILRTKEPVTAIAYSPDGSSLLLTTGRRVALWNRVSPEPSGVFPDSDAELLCLAYSPDGTLLATGGVMGQVCVWDVRTATLLVTLQADGRRRAEERPQSVAAVRFSPDGRTLAVGQCHRSSPSRGPGTLRLWAVPSWELQLSQDHPAGILAIGFSPDGKVLATGDGDGDLRLCDSTRADHVRKFTRSPEVRSIAFGKALLIYGGGWCQEPNIATFRDASTDTSRLFPEGGPNGEWVYVDSLALSPDGVYFAVGELTHKPNHHYRVRLWHLPSGELSGTLYCDRRVTCVAFSPQGNELAVACGEWGAKEPAGEVRIWKLPLEAPSAR